MLDFEQSKLIVDGGSLMTKGSRPTKKSPYLVPTIVGRSKDIESMMGTGKKENYVGDEAVSKRALLNLSYPMMKGRIRKFDEMELIWEHLFYNEIRLDPSQHCLMMSEPLFVPLFEREKKTEIMFEKFKVPFFHLSSQGLLSLYASGRGTGTVVIFFFFLYILYIYIFIFFFFILFFKSIKN